MTLTNLQRWQQSLKQRWRRANGSIRRLSGMKLAKRIENREERHANQKWRAIQQNERYGTYVPAQPLSSTVLTTIYQRSVTSRCAYGLALGSRTSPTAVDIGTTRKAGKMGRTNGLLCTPCTLHGKMMSQILLSCGCVPLPDLGNPSFARMLCNSSVIPTQKRQ
jgi:hypothetical protein